MGNKAGFVVSSRKCWCCLLASKIRIELSNWNSPQLLAIVNMSVSKCMYGPNTQPKITKLGCLGEINLHHQTMGFISFKSPYLLTKTLHIGRSAKLLWPWFRKGKKMALTAYLFVPFRASFRAGMARHTAPPGGTCSPNFC